MSIIAFYVSKTNALIGRVIGIIASLFYISFLFTVPIFVEIVSFGGLMMMVIIVFVSVLIGIGNIVNFMKGYNIQRSQRFANPIRVEDL